VEIHVELNTKSKMFCGCPAEHFSVEPNTHTCPVCLGLPGALPVPNKKAVEDTIMIGLALDCEIARESKFDRKHYFYPDLPKGYQISQYDEPLCFKGTINTTYGQIGITRVHLEEDTAKLQHTLLDGKKVSLVDFNRSSVPLVEIVTEPDITSAKQAKEYAQKIHQLVQYLGVSGADMEKGSMRVEANISWGLDLGYKVEVKNINSFRFLEKAIEYELTRQKEILDNGETPIQETRGWNETKSITFSQRTKEDAQDYRYFPEPDIPPMVFTDDQINAIKNTMPELPDSIKTKLLQLSIREDYATLLTSDQTKAKFVLRLLKEADQKDVPEIIKLLVNKPDTFSKTFKDILLEIHTTQSKPVASSEDMNKWIEESIASNPDVVTKYKSGKTAVIGVLVGNVMRLSKGQADAKTINQKLIDMLK
jgi:aspartyl-tRNA(Asn)/glutamyl-tRNA(Gln) amidotransferase subunit B